MGRSRTPHPAPHLKLAWTALVITLGSRTAAPELRSAGLERY